MQLDSVKVLYFLNHENATSRNLIEVKPDLVILDFFPEPPLLIFHVLLLLLRFFRLVVEVVFLCFEPFVRLLQLGKVHLQLVQGCLQQSLTRGCFLSESKN